MRKRNPNIQDVDIILLQINIDDIPVFMSTNSQFWPILGKLVKPFVGDSFVIGLYFGEKKSGNFEFLLKDIIYCQITYTLCEKCTQHGVWAGRMTFAEVIAPLCTDVSFVEMADEEHHLRPSPLLHTGLRMVTQFALDYMHLVCLGVMRYLILMWMKHPLNCRQGINIITSISSIIVNMKALLPKEFARKPRSLFEVKRWKATELRKFLFYIGPVALAGKLSCMLYHYFMLIFVGIYKLPKKKEICVLYNDLPVLFV
ncbi:uncharacterized protein LOC106465177 [Limulus polyphemus]|uniref:Uncharacterized protein LOC106465177 n=1 Tax=Limulus polyphemus TaxID=6850 RepID=A0ABM1SYL8_LIMPO|nr:uncharacterized protein LOC106465177 [Limulus polyphemus]